MTLVSWVESASAEEQRCKDLGAACICSEPLNTNSFTLSGGDSLNPTDTNSKQCSNGGTSAMTMKAGESAFLIPTAETGMPAGNSVNWVWRNNHTYGPALEGNGNTPLRSSTKRVCYRYYTRFSENYDGGDIRVNPSSPNCDVGKFSQIQWTPAGYFVGVGSGGRKGRSSAPSLQYNWSGVNRKLSETGPLTYADCYGNWCRFEMCVSGDFAGGTGNFFAEGHMIRLSDSKRVDWIRTNMGTGTPGLNLAFRWIYESYRENSSLSCTNGGSPSSYASWREASHLMQAEFTADAGTFIGPAYEIEGTSGTPPPPPPNPDPPPTPGAVGKPGTPTYQAP